ncbi:MAG: leucine-rich repeat domain-containing protein [Acholeplasmatales bacterium]|nr:leucine-rich repeat domain-containing protein [Acholeplasmatales bacterium]
MKTRKVLIISFISLISLIIIVSVLFFTIPHISYRYIKETDTYEVKHVYGISKDYTIPEYHNNKKVTSIGVRAFENKNVKHVYIEGHSLNKISRRAFYNSGLEYINIPKSVAIIEQNAFSYSKALKEVNFEEDSTLIAITGSTFFNCSSLEKVSNIDNVYSIGSLAFFNCKSLKDLSLNKTIIYPNAFVYCNIELHITSNTVLKEGYNTNANINLIKD